MRNSGLWQVAGRMLSVCCFTAAMTVSFSLGAGAHPLEGCYERTYDAAHLAKHRKQLVSRVSLLVEPPPVNWPSAPGQKIAASGKLRIWVRGRMQSFDSSPICEASGAGLLCNGSLSAAEASTCKSKSDGVRDCRIDGNDPGGFSIEQRPDGVILSIRKRLELVPAPFDAGPFLSLSEASAEHRSFHLAKRPGGCM